MAEDQKVIEGPGLHTPDPDDLEQHPDAEMCECGHPLYRHGKDKDGNPIPDGPQGPMCQRARYCGCKGFKRAGMELVVTKPEHAKEYELIRQMGNLSIDQWPDPRILAVRQMYAAEAKNSAQLAMFLDAAGKHMLDPALNEVQLIQTDRGPKVYAGRDGFLRSASLHPQMYGGIQSGVVYPQDRFKLKVYVDANDPRHKVVEVLHEFEPLKRVGRPHGAYCIVYDAQGNPTYVYRETEKCQVKSRAGKLSKYWQDGSVDDAIHNRAIAGALRRVVPLGGLLIHGEEPIGSIGAVEEEVQRGTLQKLRKLHATLVDQEPEDPDEPDFHVDEAGRPDPEELEASLEELTEKYSVPPEAVMAWAKQSGAFPDDPNEWGDEEKVSVLQELEASRGLDFIRAYAEHLTSRMSSTAERLDVLSEINNIQDRAKLDELVARLLERSAT